MATATITSTITDGSGTALSGVTVTARLKPGPAFTSGGVEIADVSTTTNGSGAWSLALEKTSNLTPTNSYWEIVEDVPAANGGSRVWSITVTANGTLYASVLAFLLPAATNPTALTVTAGDARYGLLGAANIWTGSNKFTNADHYFGANANSASGTMVHLGSLGDAANAYVVAEGSASNVGLILKGKGTGTVSIKRSDDTQLLNVLGIALTGSQSAVQINFNGTTRTLELGAVDSGGTGYTMVRVAN